MVHLTPTEWILGTIGALAVGLSKTGIAGIGILAVVVFAIAFPSRESVGIVLPILIFADVVAVASYRRHAVWSHLLKLFPWAATGIVIGYFAMGKIDNALVARMMGILSIVLVGLQLWRRQAIAKGGDNVDKIPHQLWYTASMGILAGFTTMIANAAGPIMILYLLSAGLPKMEFMGTGAWFFLIMNSFKVPFMANLGLINMQSLPKDAIFGPIAVVGAFFGRAILPKIDQKVFENVALAMTVLAGAYLLFK